MHLETQPFSEEEWLTRGDQSLSANNTDSSEIEMGQEG